MKYFIKNEAKRGDIFWIEPNKYRQQGENVIQGVRPAIIVSNNIINQRRFTYEVVYLTTTPRMDATEHCTIRSSNTLSTALCDQVSTISSEQIGKYIGRCTDDEMTMVEACMSISLNLSNPVTTGQWSPAEPVATTTAYTMIDPEEEEYSQEDQDYIEELEANVEHLAEENAKLRIALEKAAHGEEIIRSLYNDLLARAFDRTDKVL